MEQWALVLADSVLLVVALAGSVLTLVRIRRVGGFAAVLAGSACGVLLVAALFDLLWWTRIYPNAVESEGLDAAAALNNVGILGSFLMISIGVGLLIAAVNVGRSPAPAADPAVNPAAQLSFMPGASAAVPGPRIPQPAAPYQSPPQPTPPQAQPAPGWTPPQQQPAQPDWNIHSGVWSIPRGTFDGPPPDQNRR